MENQDVKQLVLPIETAQALLNYLASRPYSEVYELVAQMQQLVPLKLVETPLENNPRYGGDVIGVNNDAIGINDNAIGINDGAIDVEAVVTEPNVENTKDK